MENNFYEIKEHIDTICKSGDYATEVNVIEYKGGKEKIDIRKWNKDTDKMLKGISLTREKNILNDYFKTE